jgi:hypothetical protein
MYEPISDMFCWMDWQIDERKKSWFYRLLDAPENATILFFWWGK